MPVAPKKPENVEVVHPDVVIRACWGEDAITIAQAKEMLGWEEVEGDDYLLVDEEGKKIRCTRNTRNRPFDRPRSEQYAQVVLQRQWAGPRGNGKTVNGEAGVIGQTGEVLSFQHRLIGLILAGQRWAKEVDIETGVQHWIKNWPEEPVLESVVVLGVDESGETTMTIDNVKPRTAADVFYTDPAIWPKEKPKDRRELCKILEFAVRFIWHRTGAKNDPYAPLLPHPEAKALIASHPRLLRAVKHIYEENAGEENFIKSVVALGTAAGLMFLQASGRTKPENYDGDEKSMDWTLWDLATEFWVKFAQQEGGFKILRKAIGAMANIEGKGGAPSAVKLGMICKAWLLFADEAPLTEKTLKYQWVEFTHSGQTLKRLLQNGLRYEPEEPGEDVAQWFADRDLIEKAVAVGGIDLGDPDEAQREKVQKAREEAKAEKKRVADAEKALKDATKASTKPEAAPKPEESMSEILSRIRKDHPGELLTWATSSDGSYAFWGNDALVAQTKGIGKTFMDDGLQKLVVPKDKVDEAFGKLKKLKVAIGVCGYQGSKKVYLGEYTPGGYIPKDDDAPTPATPLAKISTKPVKPAAPTPESTEKPKTAPAKSGKASTKPVLKGGIK